MAGAIVEEQNCGSVGLADLSRNPTNPVIRRKVLRPASDKEREVYDDWLENECNES